MLRRRGIVALPDFVCNAGAVIGYRSAADATPDEVLAAVEAMVTGLIFEALHHPAGPLAGACERAGRFLRGWWGEPPGPPYAPEGWPSCRLWARIIVVVPGIPVHRIHRTARIHRSNVAPVTCCGGSVKCVILAYR